MTQQQKDALEQIAAAAVAAERATGLPAEISAAQAALESGWLAHAPGCNCFGIKWRPRHGPNNSQILMTSEYDAAGQACRVSQQFAVFRSLADCFVDHARLLTTAGVYRKPWAQYQVDRDVEQLMRGIAPVYATDPHYAEQVLRVMEMPELRAAVATARF